MVSHSSILAWRIPMDRGAWGYSLWGRKEPNMNGKLGTAPHSASQSPVGSESPASLLET